MAEYYVGLMSGTSMDGIDAALVDFSNDQPLLIASQNTVWPEHIHKEIQATQSLSDDDLGELDPLDVKAGNVFADAANAVIKKAGISPRDIIAIGSHGQTIRHKPDGPQPFSLQIGNAQTIASQTKVSVVSDFRTADIKAGGEGAPLAPAFHDAVFRSHEENRIIINIGGIANVTLLPAERSESVTGFDCGPGNTLMDVWISQHQNKNYDDNGNWASSGTINKTLLDKLMDDAYFERPAPKSTGFEYFNLDWLKSYLDGDTDNSDVQATLCELTALSIANAVKDAGNKARVLVCGGGVHNQHLMSQIQNNLPGYEIESTESFGIHPDWVEAMAFAWLARQTINGNPGNLPSVTGAKSAVVLGKITAT